MASSENRALFQAVAVATGSSKKTFNSNHYNIRAAPDSDAWVQVLVKEGEVWCGLAIDPVDAAEARNSKVKYEASLRTQLAEAKSGWSVWSPAARPNVWYVMRRIGPTTDKAASLAASIAATCLELEGALANDELLEI